MNTPMPPPPGPGEAVPPRPVVYTDGDQRSLMFADAIIQSDMLLSDPEALTLAYTRAIMCFTLFRPAPRHVLMVGLGGGSLAKFCLRYLPGTRVTVVEIDAQVIALRDSFAVPPDGERLRVVHADAADYLAALGEQVDVLIVDGFDVHGQPPALASAGFYAHCRRVLAPGGVAAINLHGSEPDYAGIVRRLNQAFGGRVCRFKGMAATNHILFAVAPGRWFGRADWVRRLVAPTQGFGVGLNRWLARAVVACLRRR